jgi:hypothetical protein
MEDARWRNKRINLSCVCLSCKWIPVLSCLSDLIHVISWLSRIESPPLPWTWSRVFPSGKETSSLLPKTIIIKISLKSRDELHCLLLLDCNLIIAQKNRVPLDQLYFNSTGFFSEVEPRDRGHEWKWLNSTSTFSLVRWLVHRRFWRTSWARHCRLTSSTSVSYHAKGRIRNWRENVDKQLCFWQLGVKGKHEG